MWIAQLACHAPETAAQEQRCLFPIESIQPRPYYCAYTQVDRIDRIVRPPEDGTEASIVRMIYHWYTVSDENLVPLTEYAITHKLSKMGIPN